MNLLVQYLKHTVDSGGVYRDIRLGISRGCPLSPLIGAFYLKILDEALGNSGLYYVRYMDDILVLAPTRWRLRHAIRVLQQAFARLKLSMHPTRPAWGVLKKGLISSAITSPAAPSGSRTRASSISWHGFIGFMSNRKRRPKAP